MIFNSSTIEPGQPCVTMIGRVRMVRLHVDEVNVDAVNVGEEHRKRVQARLGPAPVIGRCPMVGELLGGHELHALGPIAHKLAAGPACGLECASSDRRAVRPGG